jgi:hypothetical protein
MLRSVRGVVCKVDRCSRRLLGSCSLLFNAAAGRGSIRKDVGFSVGKDVVGWRTRARHDLGVVDHARPPRQGDKAIEAARSR